MYLLKILFQQFNNFLVKNIYLFTFSTNRSSIGIKFKKIAEHLILIFALTIQFVTLFSIPLLFPKKIVFLLLFYINIL